jgi:error-prone DNA polymerase
VVHLVAHRLTDLSVELATVGSRDAAFPLAHGPGDQVTHASGGPDPRELPPKGLRTPPKFPLNGGGDCRT